MNYLSFWYVWVIFFIAYFTIEFVVSLFFNYKISMITQKKFNWAAFNGGMATFLFMFSMLLASFVAMASDDASTGTRVLFLVWTTLGTTAGNVTSTILLPRFNQILDNKKQRKENKEEK